MKLIPTYCSNIELERSYTYNFLYYGGYEHSLPTKYESLRMYDHRPWTWKIPRKGYTRILKHEIN